MVAESQLEGDGWEVGPDCLVSGLRSVPADYRLRVQRGICLQQTDLTYQEDEGEGEDDDEGEEEDEDEEEGEDENENEDEGVDEDAEVEEDGDEDEDEEEDAKDEDETELASNSFVLSLFGIEDDIKAHYTAERARFCGAKWKTFLAYSGATVDDVWTDVPEADRKLWSAKVFPVHVRQEGDQVATGSSVSPLENVLWMQHVRHVEGEGGVVMGGSGGSDKERRIRTAQTQAWLSSERLSFKDILRRANPAAEFRWRRSLEKAMKEDLPFPVKGRR